MTSTVPGETVEGAVAVIVVGEVTVNDAEAVPPKSTSLAVRKFVPVMLTLTLPLTGPSPGLTPVTVGTPW